MKKKSKPEKKGKTIPSLRNRAEEKLASSSCAPTEMKEKNHEKTIHELRVHQIELEMQNEELRNAQLALEESRDKYIDLYDFAPVGYFTFTPGGIIKNVNLTGASLLGIEREKLINSGFGRFVTEENLAQWDRHIMEVLGHGEKLICEIPLKRNNGFTFYARIESIKIDLNSRASVVHAAVSDITERKQMENALRESEERFRQIAESAEEWIWEVNKDGLYTYASNVVEKILGYKPEEIVGKKHFYDFFSSDKREQMKKEAFEVFATKRAFTKYVNSNVHKNGSIILIETSGAPILDSRGNLLGYRGVDVDITDQKKLEYQLLQSQKMESIGTLAGGIAHDFNNILTAIIGYASVTKMKMPEDDPLRHNLEQILASSERAANLTQSLLAFSRKQISNPEPVNLSEIVKKAEKFLSRVIGEEIELKMTLSENSLTVLVDVGQIEQVLMNLATNARDAMPKGGVLTIQTEPVEFDSEFVKAFGYGEVGRYACIIISDTGIGMDEATKERIYEPFFTTKEVGKGTGLGLSMVYGIIKQHNGYINCYSESGKGTTFKIYLPLFESMPVPKTVIEGAAAAVPAHGTETILLAEDEESVRKLMKAVLEADGYKVIEAADGEEAVNKFMENKDRIDILLLDIVMPKMSGREVYERIKKIKPDIKLLMASGYPADFISQKGIIEEGLNFIAKPMFPTKLLKKVRAALDK